MKTKVILTVLALIATIGLISAQNTKAETSKSASKNTCYVDANNNNVCDNYENKTCTQETGKVFGMEVDEEPDKDYRTEMATTKAIAIARALKEETVKEQIMLTSIKTVHVTTEK